MTREELLALKIKPINKKIEKDICKEVINTNQLNTCIDVDSLKEKIIFPYTYTQNQAVIIDEGVFSKKFPKAYKYLLDKAGIENNVDKLIEIQKELEELDMEILSLMEEWEELENELKTLKNTF